MMGFEYRFDRSALPSIRYSGTPLYRLIIINDGRLLYFYRLVDFPAK